jgi:polysaccharide biosynthesis/export protein
MRTRILFWIGLLLLSVVTGCRSYGPRFDIRGPGAAAGAGGTNVAGLPDTAFTAVTPTNEIRPEWLKPSTNLFQLGPGDVFEIEVLGEAAPRNTVTVGPDGKIYYSLLPGLSVWGLTLTDAKQLLEKELNRFIREKPEVALTLRGVGSKRFWMLGSVQTPGVYSLGTPTTLLDAISAAGGVLAVPGSSSGMPDLKNSFVLRKGEVLRVDFHRLLSAGDFSQNIYLEPDDFVFLRASTSRNVYVMGAVPAPNIIPYSEQLSLGSALALAGGTIEYAQISQVAIIRGSLSSPRIAMVNYRDIYKGKAPDVLLEQGDIVYVSFVPYRRLAMFVEACLRQFVYSVASNEGYRASGSAYIPSTGTAPTPAAAPALPPR